MSSSSAHPSPTLTRDQCRRVDRLAIEEFGMVGLVLMENAGRGVVDGICRLGLAPPVLVCCGKGNNAGDGLVIARHLDLRGWPVRVLIWAAADELTGDAGANFRILAHTDVPIELCDSRYEDALLERRLGDAGLIVDALLGTGARGEPRPPFDRVIDRINAAAATRVAVDLPSGLDCDTGQAARHTIRAAHTFTFLAAKPGFFVPGVEQYTGEVHVCDIGVPAKLLARVRAEG